MQGSQVSVQRNGSAMDRFHPSFFSPVAQDEDVERRGDAYCELEVNAGRVCVVGGRDVDIEWASVYHVSSPLGA